MDPFIWCVFNKIHRKRLKGKNIKTRTWAQFKKPSNYTIPTKFLKLTKGGKIKLVSLPAQGRVIS